MAKRSRYTVYDMLDEKGVFEENPANPCAGSRYVKQNYPKMFYHPKGEERIVQRAEVIATPAGHEKVGELRQMITKIAENEEEADKLLSEGWWDHPAKAIKARGGEVPPTIDSQVDEKDAEILRLRKELAKVAALAKSRQSEVAG